VNCARVGVIIAGIELVQKMYFSEVLFIPLFFPPGRCMEAGSVGRSLNFFILKVSIRTVTK
jgi:hypothetical protein